jgi:hypothetical protein
LLKNGNKTLLLFLLFLCIAGAGLATNGLIFVTSNIVHVNAEYTVLLSVSGSNTRINLNARVRFNGNPVGAGINVDFYYSLNGSDWIYFATEATNRGGVARVTYTVTIDGDYNFTATVSSV